MLLVIEQWYTSAAIPRTHNPLLPPSTSDLFLHTVHNYGGLLIAALVLIRIGLRWLKPRPPETPGWRERVSHLVHWVLYLSLLGQATAGFAAAYIWAPAGRIHILFWNVTLVPVGIHITAAAYHMFRRDGIAGRMIVWPGR
ncbi:cytochrome b [Chelativorans alearense]|uniref:cytochrome b n=1 Tax=Chelativorans alearense TaxID=2681495 RepID=UPI001FE8D994|nr:cytochrome b/b6 domain-containing protein [Chelativorans alearense]